MNATKPERECQGRTARFSKSYRLTRTDDFSSVFSFRKAIRSANFLLHYRPRKNGQFDGARLGLVIAKRNLRRSVDRNLLRRLVREAFRTQRSELPCCDLIFRLASKPALPLERKGLAEEIRSLLGKMRDFGR